MEISWGLLLFLLVLITPGLVLLIFFRLLIPRPRSIIQNDLILLSSLCLISLLLNFDLIRYLASSAAYWIPFDGERVNGSTAILNLFYSPDVSPYFRFLKKDDFFSLVGDLQIRAFVAGIAVLILGRLSEWTARFSEYLLPAPMFKVLSYFPSRIFSWLRPVFYHPWQILCASNSYSDLRMVDIMTSEGSLYSGVFTSFVPNGNGVSSVSMKTAFRFYPDSTHSSAIVPTTRKRALVKNYGELTIFKNQIQTIHFWNMSPGTTTIAQVRSVVDLEYLKWLLLLNQNYSVKQPISVLFKATDQNFTDIVSELSDWHLNVSGTKKLPTGVSFTFEIPIPVDTDTALDLITSGLNLLMGLSVAVTKLQLHFTDRSVEDKFIKWANDHQESVAYLNPFLEILSTYP